MEGGHKGGATTGTVPAARLEWVVCELLYLCDRLNRELLVKLTAKEELRGGGCHCLCRRCGATRMRATAMAFVPCLALAVVIPPLHPALLEPSPNDPIVTEADDLMQRVASATEPISLRLQGHILLPSQLRIRPSTAIPKVVTLWAPADLPAVLDGNSSHRIIELAAAALGGGVPVLLLENINLVRGRIGSEDAVNAPGGCLFLGPAWFRMRGGGFQDCAASGFGGAMAMVGDSVEPMALINVIIEDSWVEQVQGVARGGGIGVQMGGVLLINVSFHGTRAISNNNFAYGGGLAVWQTGVLDMHNVSFVNTTAESQRNLAWGGGIGMANGLTTAQGVIFIQTEARAYQGRAFGGGIGMNGGTLTEIGSRYHDTRASTVISFPALGGAIGVAAGVATSIGSHIIGSSVFSQGNAAEGGGFGVGGGSLTAYDTLLEGTLAVSEVLAQGGGCAVEAGSLHLNNVTISHAAASGNGMVLATRNSIGELTSARLTVRHHCTEGDPRTLFYMEFRALMRNMTLDTQGCSAATLLAHHDVLLPGGDWLHQCGDTAVVCGPQAECTPVMDSVFNLSTPGCRCPANDPRASHDDWIPSALAHSPTLAPYLEGCVTPAVGAVVLRENFWRLTDRTMDIHTCIQSPSWRPGDATPCLGGTNASSLCADGLMGPRCQLCVNEESYFDGLAECRACLSWADATPYVVLLLTAAVLIGAAYGRERHLQASCCERERRLLISCCRPTGGRGLDEAPAEDASASTRNPCGLLLAKIQNSYRLFLLLAPQLGLAAKAKLVYSYYQIVVIMPVVYAVPVPPVYSNAMQVFSWITFDWLPWFAPPGISCFGGFGAVLAVAAIGPFVLLGLLTVASLGVDVAFQRARAQIERADQPLRLAEAFKHAILHVLPVMLLAVFALLPFVCSRIFAAFSCEEFGVDDELGTTRAYLAVDLSVECDTYEHLPPTNAHTLLAWVLVFLWPVGIPLCLFVLLWLVQSKTVLARCFGLTAEDEELLWKACGFLHDEYRAELPYFELLETLRKLLLSGFVLLIPLRLVLLRLILAFFLTTGYLILLQAVEPFRQRGTGTVAVATISTLSCTLFAGLLIRISEELPPEERTAFFGWDEPDSLIILLISFHFGVLAVALPLLLYYASDGPNVLRVKPTGAPPVLELPPRTKWHMFLSHRHGDSG